MDNRTDREIELTGIIAELKVVMKRVADNRDLSDEIKRAVSGPVSDAIADAQYFLQIEMDERIGYVPDDYAVESDMHKYRSGVYAR